MNLHDLQENKFAILHRALSEVFETDFDFNMPVEKMEKVHKVTTQRIAEMKQNGVNVSDRNFQKLLLVSEGLKLVLAQKPIQEEIIEESDALDQAEVLLAAKQMADDLQKMAENLASMQVEDLMSITNAMKEEVGLAEAEAFEAAASAAIGGALDAVKAANEGVSNAVLAAQGQQVPTDMEAPMDIPAEDPAMDPEAPAEEMPDDFEGADAADEMTDADGREMKETVYLNAIKMVKEAQKEGKVNKDVLQQAFESLKMLKPTPKVAKENTKGAFAGGGNSVDGKAPAAPKKAPVAKPAKSGASAGSQHAFK